MSGYSPQAVQAMDVEIKTIHARWVATVEPDQPPVLEDQVITMKDGKIASIVPRSQFEGSPDVHLATHIVIPGLINCHTHTPMTLLRGWADDLDLQSWLHENIFPAEGAFVAWAAQEDAQNFVRCGSELAVYEMLKTGTTFFNDMYFHGDVTADVVRKVGMRAMLAPMGMLYFGDEQFDPLVKLNAEWFAQIAKDGGDLVYPSMIPHSAYMVPEHKLKELKDAYDKAAPGQKYVVHTHLHETRKEISDVLEKNDKSAVEIFDQVGMLQGMVAAHCVHMTDAEIELLVSRGVSVAHNPRSNLKLGSGIAPIAKMLKAGVNVCIGTDGASSNNTLDMLTEMQFASFLAKGAAEDPTVVSALEVLRMGTLAGAKALGRDQDLGSLKAGKAADIVAVDLGHVECAPIYDPLGALVFTNKRDVSHVWVNGQCLVKDGQVLTLQLDMAKIDALLAKLREFRTTLPCGKNAVGSIGMHLCKSAPSSFST